MSNPATGSAAPSGDIEATKKTKSALNSLSPILQTPLPAAISSASNPAVALLNDVAVSTSISSLLRLPDSGGGDNALCRWLYDSFHSHDPALQLVVISYVPLLTGVYLSRTTSQRPRLAGLEALLLTFYSHETEARASQPITVTVPELANPSIYHDTGTSPKRKASDLHIGFLSRALEPHNTVRATYRARIVGVALELYYTKVHHMPLRSKLEFCEYCEVWAGQLDAAGDNDVALEGRIPLPWELLQPTLRILGHCMMRRENELHEKAIRACRSLYVRAIHDINPNVILATEGLLRLIKLDREEKDIDYTEVPSARVISI